MTSGIYRIVNTFNDKCYVGQSANFINRKKWHFTRLKNNKHANRHLQFAYNKYGAECFEFEILEEVALCGDVVVDRANLCASEQKWIDQFRSSDDDYGYNILPAAGSNLGFSPSDESRLKMSRAAMGRKASQETRIKMSNAHKGKKMPPEDVIRRGLNRRGSKHTEEARLKMSLAHKGVKLSEERRRGIIERLIGHFVSDETRERISKANTGKTRTDEQKLRMSQSRTRRYLVTFPNGDTEVIISMAKFCAEHNLTGTCMSRILSGIQKQHKGFKIVRLEDASDASAST